MKFEVEIENYECESLEELFEKRERLKKVFEEGNYSERLENAINNYGRIKYHKHIEAKVEVNALCSRLIFTIKGTCNTEENEAISKELTRQLSDGVFENFDCFDWTTVERVRG